MDPVGDDGPSTAKSVDGGVRCGLELADEHTEWLDDDKKNGDENVEETKPRPRRLICVRLGVGASTGRIVA